VNLICMRNRRLPVGHHEKSNSHPKHIWENDEIHSNIWAKHAATSHAHIE
jgi:hypothetical protein